MDTQSKLKEMVTKEIQFVRLRMGEGDDSHHQPASHNQAPQQDKVVHFQHLLRTDVCSSHC